MKKILCLMLVLLLISVLLSAVEVESDDEFLKEILISDVPVVYGDENFRERILERTKGERDPIGLVLTGIGKSLCAYRGIEIP